MASENFRRQIDSNTRAEKSLPQSWEFNYGRAYVSYVLLDLIVNYN